ncbi:YwqJ-related putative deaminase [Pseudoalteromonas carrageenovora]|uniref:YwqJ-related putative deaminase n=1 Tax=Pseudoalteromonas TaxID=53246 RepID=UPI0009E6D42F|nr:MULTISPECIES: YwqJ-related putative deaminase [Pseudoalteromonas]MDO6635383.1 YwqJ-related putative deaminase [Pseudoalteromonas carrageenovora]MDO6647464.1 YwqJ-related putative deaminase [Pseudoalteromonas carrageenovora]
MRFVVKGKIQDLTLLVCTRLITEIKSYLDFTYKHEIQIPHGRAGAPGLHAEVRSVNKILKENPTVSFSDISIATVRLKGDDAGTNFPACMNCSGILQKFEIITGRVD